MVSVAPGDSETRCFGAAVRLTVFPSLRGSCTGNVSFEETSGVISPLADGVAVLLLDPPPPQALIASANVAMKARKIRGRGLRFMHPPAVVLARGIRTIACRKKKSPARGQGTHEPRSLPAPFPRRLATGEGRSAWLPPTRVEGYSCGTAPASHRLRRILTRSSVVPAA